MDERLDLIREIDDKMFEVEQAAGQYLGGLLQGSSIPKTSLLFVLLISHINFIKGSVFDCAEREDIYSLKILFRALLEHHLRFNFLFFEYGSTKDDKISKEYYEIIEISEKIDLLKSIHAARSVSGLDEIKLDDMWNMMLAEFPQYRNHSKGKVIEGMKKFSIKNIIKYVEKHLNMSKGDSSILPNMILNYTELSSYVHGGIFAANQMLSYADEKLRREEIINLSSLSFLIGGSTRLFSYMIFSKYDKRFLKSYQNIDELMKFYNTKYSSLII